MPSCLGFMSSLPSKTVQAPAARSGSLASRLPWPSTGHQGTADKRCNHRETRMPCTGHRSEQPDSQAPDQLSEQQRVERHANEGHRERRFLYGVPECRGSQKAGWKPLAQFAWAVLNWIEVGTLARWKKASHRWGNLGGPDEESHRMRSQRHLFRKQSAWVVNNFDSLNTI